MGHVHTGCVAVWPSSVGFSVPPSHLHDCMLSMIKSTHVKTEMFSKDRCLCGIFSFYCLLSMWTRTSKNNTYALRNHTLLEITCAIFEGDWCIKQTYETELRYNIMAWLSICASTHINVQANKNTGICTWVQTHVTCPYINTSTKHTGKVHQATILPPDTQRYLPTTANDLPPPHAHTHTLRHQQIHHIKM